MMQTGFWRHKNFRDVDMHVVHALEGPDYWCQLVRWWRRDFGSGGFFLGDLTTQDQVQVSKKQLAEGEWEYLG